ncbi:hypothetical protein CAEBREN_22963 [Caenorhabditis brenneri]|uniref:7TM GPCR serpentine receptor class x (Srx) domain-containing protein n=1 Tax=Caenorhabditis brenneri TaxID=135651 RepID=G0M978_CAEBE|nr:hypothetical protein CAEBREN_22963 [Caenorhabditis brenneri]
MMYRLLFLLYLIIASTDGAHKYAHLDSRENLEKVRVCEVEGYIDRDTFQLHGNLYNCSTPPMSCSIPFHEGFDKNKRNVECRVPTDSDFFYNDECLLGTIMLTLIIIGCFKIPSMRTPFGNLTMNQSMSQIVASFSNGTFFFLAFVVKRAIKLMVFINWAFPLLTGGYLMVFKECGFQFFIYGWTFSSIPNRELCGTSLRTFLTLMQIPITVLTVICDLITLLFLIIGRNRIFKSKSAEMKRREMNFARQVLAQGAVSLAHSYWYNKGRDFIPGFSEEWRIFLTTSFSSNLLHVFESTVVFTCNHEFKDWLLRTKKKQTAFLVSTIRGNSHS